jgi:hypothetical protein
MAACIFCKGEEHLGRAVEHIFPESLGNAEKVLPAETVCLKCNNGILSRLDQAFMNFEPIAMIKAFLQIPSKKNKLKDLHLGDIEINNSERGHVGVKLSKGSQFEQQEPLDGWERFRLHGTGSRKLTATEYKLVARALLKQAYGCMYLDHGYDFVTSADRDAFRRAVVVGDSFHGRLLLGNSATIDHTKCHLRYSFVHGKDGVARVLVYGSFFGIEMATIFPECDTGATEMPKLSILPFSKND